MTKTWMLVTLLAVGCGSSPTKPAETPATPTTAAATVEEGNGWNRQVEAGHWVWKNDDGVAPSSTKLGTQPGGRGILAMTLPKGATSASLIWAYISYAAPGEATWELYTTSENGEPSGKPVWTSDVTITADQIAGVGQAPRYEKATQLDFGDGGEVTSPFFLVFTTRSGSPAVGAVDGEGNVRYQPPGGAPQAVPFKAFIRVVVGSVK